MVLHSCACVYLWYASNVATFIADHFSSFIIKIRMFYVGLLYLW